MNEHKSGPSQEPNPSAEAADNQTDARIMQHADRCNQLYDQHDLAGAEREANAALEIDSDHPVPRFMLGVIYRDQERDEESEALFQGLLDQPEITAKVHNNLGLLAKRREDWAVAKQHFRTAMEAEFQFAAAHYNLGLALLMEGQLAEGFREYEWRWYTDQFTRLKCLQPRWHGKPFDGTLLVHTEQGIGDVFQFCRYLPALRARCRRLLLACTEKLADFFPVPEWADELVFPGVDLGQSFECYLPLLSAPQVLGTTLESVPCDVPYLRPQPRSVPLGTPHVTDPRLRVGITWAGSPTHAMDGHRSCRLSAFAPILAVPNTAFYSLQKGHGREQLTPVYSSLRDVDDLQADFHDTAAMVKQLDLIISVDTAVVHLAGGLGIPTWCLLSRRCDWRWMSDREDSPWYPTLRLFRQATLDEWPELMHRVAAELTAVTAGTASLPIRLAALA